MIFITGDTHGEIFRFTLFREMFQPSVDDYLIVAGDFGCIFGLGWRDENKLDELEKLPFTILFLDGNHECFPKIMSYPEEEWNGGRIHRIRSNIFHLMRGQIFVLEGLSIFTMGGGYSIDQMLRIPGRSWWPEEMPNANEYAEALSNLAKHGDRVDVIISHAAPEGAMQFFVDTGIITNRFLQEQPLNTFLEKVRQTVLHKHYYFGHMHLDKRLPHNQTALFTDVYCLNTGKETLPRQTLDTLSSEISRDDPIGNEVW